MGSVVLAAGVLVAGLVMTVVVGRRLRDRAAAVARLGEPDVAPPDRDADFDRPGFADARPFARRYYWPPWVAGLAVGAIVFFALHPRVVYVIVPVVMVGLLGNELDRLRVARRVAKIETQLGDAIDLMVGALRAGAGATAALDAAASEVRWPLRPQLAEVVGRIRLGDDPQAVLRDLTRRVPLENVVLFVSALSVHWEVGGSLAGTLATVGKAIRDRTELGRRIQSLTAQSRASVGAVLLATYFIAAVIWRNNPDRMVAFLSSQVGSWLVGLGVLMQVVGVVWTTAASRVRY